MAQMIDQYGGILDVALQKRLKEMKVKDEDYLVDRYTKHIKKSTEIIILDVGGTKFYVYKSIFSTWPTTR